MLPKTFRLHKARDFVKLGTQGRPVFGPLFTMRVREVKQEGRKVAFITSTKAMKLAVDRNRAKRRMRALLRALIQEVPENVHVAFILKPEVAFVPFVTLEAEVRRVLGKIPEALKQPARLSPRAVKIQAKRAAAIKPPENV